MVVNDVLEGEGFSFVLFCCIEVSCCDVQLIFVLYFEVCANLQFCSVLSQGPAQRRKMTPLKRRKGK